MGNSVGTLTLDIGFGSLGVFGLLGGLVFFELLGGLFLAVLLSGFGNHAGGFFFGGGIFVFFRDASFAAVVDFKIQMK